MNNRTRKIIAALLCVASVAILTVGSIAYFTDRVEEKSEATTANLQIELADLQLDTTDVIIPGSIMPLTYTVNNIGEITADEREKIALSVYKTDGMTPVSLSESPSEFEIYKRSDVELVEGKGYEPKVDASPIGKRVTDGFEGTGNNYIIYQLEQTTLDNLDNELSDSAEDTLSRDFVVLFRNTSSNTFQDVTVKIDVLVEAKQHEYTSAYNDDWTELQSGSIDFSTGSQSVVPAKEE